MSGFVKKYKTIGICVSRVQEDYQNNIVKAICKEAQRRGYKVLIFNTFVDMAGGNFSVNGSKSIFKLIKKEHVDGLVILSESIKGDDVCREIISFANDNDIPVLTLERKIDDCTNIQFDYSQAFESIVRHVIEKHNCRVVNFIAGHKDNSFSEERLDCFKRVLADNNIPFDETRVGYGNFWEVPTREVMERFLADERGLPEAIICCNDIMALVVCQMLQEHGYKVPEDIIVTGFDGIEAEKYASPRLTTAVTNFNLIGREVMAVLTSMEGGRPAGEINKVGFKIKIAQSCGCKQVNAFDAIGKITELYNKIAYMRGHESFMFTYLSNALDCKTFKGLAKVAARHSEGLNIWLCLNHDYFYPEEDKPKYNDLFCEDIAILFHAENGSLRDFGTEFKLDEYLPDFNNIMDEYDVLLFNPVNYQGITYGYMVSAADTDDFKFDATHRYVDNTCHILESIHKSIQLNRAYKELKEMHIRDALTGLYNRRGFEQKCEELVASCKEDNKEILIVSVDMDNLKTINDRYGHAMGDVAITTAADILNEFSKTLAVVARFGGDEYVLAIGSESGKRLFEELSKYVDKKTLEFNSSDEYPFELKISIGAAIAGTDDMQAVHDALQLADSRMYEQKRLHKQQTNANR